MSSKVSVLGLGAMGTALATKFLENGYQTTLWNRTTEKAASLVERGCRLSATIPDALQASDLILICLIDAQAVKETLSRALQSLAGKTVINLTNGTPDQARQLSELVLTHGGTEYIHGGIMAVPAMIGSSEAVLLYSGGSQENFRRVKKDLSILGTGKFLSEDAGSASLYDLALLSGMYGLFSGFLHATALVRSGEKEATATGFMSLLVPWLSGMIGYLGVMAKQIDEGNYVTQGSNIAMQIVAVENILEASETNGVSADVIHPIKSLMKLALAAGRENEDISALIEHL
ncbi:unnamed protein product [Penicillium egyptiacum]|uniref:6-phosphogluconate dehydrogenase NADP-binding domain-containing protein n=1 Tax=Penicillium egyptiacum TaxID=1303716 RepID=A0A9W4P744_9EURO|nr:unnamed protein product [Penicillium egyptiacum]